MSLNSSSTSQFKPRHDIVTNIEKPKPNWIHQPKRNLPHLFHIIFYLLPSFRDHHASTTDSFQKHSHAMSLG